MSAPLLRLVETEAPPVETAPDLWLSARQIADMKLPGLPRGRDAASAKRMINELAQAERWHARVAADGTLLARSRKGRGGGIEYRLDVLPAAARVRALELLAPVQEAPASPEQGSDIWAWFGQQSDKARAEAQRRLEIVLYVEDHARAGQTRTAALASAAALHGLGISTLATWLAMVRGVAITDWLPHLAPRYEGGGRSATCDPAAWNALISDYLRPERPGFEACVRRVRRSFPQADIPPSRTLWRKLDREIDPLVVIKRREGREAHERTLPPQIRTVSGLHALELVNVDGHTWDVFVRWPDGTIARPIMVAIQDVYSRKVLAWRVDISENILSTRLAFYDLFRNFGVPRGALLDNGRAFASLALTNGVKTRYRWKNAKNEPLGLLPAMGINPSFATPYHGQAKPIERAFRDMCDDIARCPDFAGAYTGNKPSAKPENYRSKAIDLATFLAVIGREIPAHNARQGRKSEMARGRSFDDAFGESVAVSVISKASTEQLQLAMLAFEKSRLNTRDGSAWLLGNRYWCPELSLHAGERVVLRFDPDDLHSQVRVYAADGPFIAAAPVWQAQGFADQAAARDMAKLRSEHRKRTRKAEDSLNLLSAAELAAMMPRAAPDADMPDPAALRPVRHRNLAVQMRPEEAAGDPSEQSERAAGRPSALDRLGAAARLRLVD